MVAVNRSLYLAALAHPAHPLHTLGNHFGPRPVLGTLA